ncbi:membrane protein [Sulfurifustis variabilis]|uniref:Membrane protein n=1 Tax=Sulfurifustis variabilis TaxID=1675686 RepID=A0A1B4VB21_9GAMM|nr:DUF445 domain-containing protein [Sulfurifustis variabilis]BAU47471.1 membrane protein [Sulfurifustis variabilis]
MASVPFSVDDPEKQARLNSMKRRATGLLLLAVAVFLGAVAYEGAYPGLGYVRAAAEAAVVGGLAHWFAVTALFRHPLGIPIPHTAIVPRRKDRIGGALGNFVQRNFLSPELIRARLGELRLAERVLRWVAEPEHAQRVAQSVARGLAGGARVLKDEDVQALIDRAVAARVRRTPLAPLVGNLLAHLTADNRHEQLLDEALRILGRTVEEHEAVIRERVRAESPWWIPEGIDDRIHDKIVTGIERTLEQVGQDREHPLRLRFDAALARFIERLRTDPELAGRAEAIKEEMLAHPAVRQFSAALWDDVKQSLIRYGEQHEAGAGAGPIEQGLRSLADAVLADPELIAKLDRWLIEAIAGLVEQYRTDVGKFISDTVAAWDPEATSRKIELQIGRDLQFVRINGTVVGALVGLALYTLSRFLA